MDINVYGIAPLPAYRTGKRNKHTICTTNLFIRICRIATHIRLAIIILTKLRWIQSLIAHTEREISAGTMPVTNQFSSRVYQFIRILYFFPEIFRNICDINNHGTTAVIVFFRAVIYIRQVIGNPFSGIRSAIVFVVLIVCPALVLITVPIVRIFLNCAIFSAVISRILPRF